MNTPTIIGRVNPHEDAGVGVVTVDDTVILVDAVERGEDGTVSRAVVPMGPVDAIALAALLTEAAERLRNKERQDELE